MCLAVPMQITKIDNDGMARVSAMGAERDIAIDLTPEAQVGDYVLVHAGFAIEVVDEQYAEETLELIKAMAELVDDPLFDAGLPDEVPFPSSGGAGGSGDIRHAGQFGGGVSSEAVPAR